MGKICKSFLINYLFWIGIFVAILLLFVGFKIFITLFSNISYSYIKYFIKNKYLLHVIIFSFQEACLSTIISVIPAIFIAKSLFRYKLWIKNFFLDLTSLILVLPVLIIIFGLLNVYGKLGLVAKLCNLLHIPYSFSIYGMNGILLAHLFLNLPLAIMFCTQALESISIEQLRLAMHLGINRLQFFRIVEWPYLKRHILSASILIFIFCFTSFTVILTIGGGPAFTTIEVVIYQFMVYEFDYQNAAFLSLIQVFFCFILTFLSQSLNNSFNVGNTNQISCNHIYCDFYKNKIDLLLIIVTSCFLILPLLSIIFDGINNALIQSLQQIELWKSFFNSIIIALISSIISIILSILLLWSSREFYINNNIFFHSILELSGLLILMIPVIVLSTGIFLLLHSKINLLIFNYIIVIGINILMSMPYNIKVLKIPMYDLAKRYNSLCNSLKIIGINRLFLIEYQILKYKIIKTFSFSCIVSIGNFSSISLFGNDSFYTLPYYFYHQLNSYRTNFASVTALLILLLCFIIFACANCFFRKKYD